MVRRVVDVIGIGALNQDHIGPLTRKIRRILTDASEDAGEPVEWGTELTVEPAVTAAVLAAGPDWTVINGGSAFNTIRTLAGANLGLRTGCVGLQGTGRTPAHREELAALGVDTDGIADVSDSVTGTCISLVDGDNRTLLIDPGANLFMPQYLRENASAVLDHLAAATVVHVTSFLDPSTPAELARLLGVLKRRAPGVLISLDPGHVWTASVSEPIAALIGLSDVLLVNEREWAGLTAVFGDDGPRVPLAMIKQRTGILALRRIGARVDRVRHRRDPLLQSQIRRPTGAGDAFAAGLLGGLARPPDDLSSAVDLGLQLAREHLQD